LIRRFGFAVDDENRDENGRSKNNNTNNYANDDNGSCTKTLLAMLVKFPFVLFGIVSFAEAIYTGNRSRRIATTIVLRTSKSRQTTAITSRKVITVLANKVSRTESTTRVVRTFLRAIQTAAADTFLFRFLASFFTDTI